MSETNMIGEANGIKLWNLMSTSDDAGEQSYFRSVQAAASKYGRVWFSDIVTQRETGKNQVIWEMNWDGNQSNWVVTKFHVCEGASEITPRMIADDVEEIVELDINDILVNSED